MHDFESLSGYFVEFYSSGINCNRAKVQGGFLHFSQKIQCNYYYYYYFQRVGEVAFQVPKRRSGTIAPSSHGVTCQGIYLKSNILIATPVHRELYHSYLNTSSLVSFENSETR